MVCTRRCVEYAGHARWVEWAGNAVEVLLALWRILFLPGGSRPAFLDRVVAVGLVVIVGSRVLAGCCRGEVFLAKLRLFRVPELLAGSSDRFACGDAPFSPNDSLIFNDGGSSYATCFESRRGCVSVPPGDLVAP